MAALGDRFFLEAFSRELTNNRTAWERTREGVVRWFRALLPREERFFDLYNAHAAILVRAAEALQAMLEGGDAIAERSREVIALEHDADIVTRDVLRAGRRTFITPLDRRDIVDLISSMDDAIDQMQQTAKAILLYDVRSFEPEMRESADAILQCARLVNERCRAAAEPYQRRSRATERSLRADRPRRGRSRWHPRIRPEEPLSCVPGEGRWADFRDFSQVYDHLEKVVDRFSDVSDEIQGIVIDWV